MTDTKYWAPNRIDNSSYQVFGPTDIILTYRLRYKDNRFAIVLPGATEYGGNRTVMRINEGLSEDLVVIGRQHYHLQPMFGFH